MNIRPTQDNVVIRLLPEPRQTAGGIVIPQQADPRRATDVRRAEVVAVGPGHYRKRKRQLGSTEYTEDTMVLVPTELRPGDVILVHARAGQDYTWDLNIPRHNKPVELTEMGDQRGEFRIIREDEALGVLEQAEAAE